MAGVSYSQGCGVARWAVNVLHLRVRVALNVLQRIEDACGIHRPIPIASITAITLPVPSIASVEKR
jgi:hypothetical protein